MQRTLPLVRRTSSFAVLIALVWGGHLRAQEEEQTQPATGQEAYDQAMAAGEAALASEDYEVAYDAFQQAYKMSPYSPGTITGRARALVGLEEFDQAEKDFNDALTMNAEFVPALVGLGEMQLEQGATDLALANFQQALEQNRRNLSAIFGLGKASILLGNADQGMRALTRYLDRKDEVEDEKKLSEAYRLRAQGSGMLLKYPEALQDIQESLTLNAEDYETYATLATILFRQEDYMRAVQAMGLAIAHYVPDEKQPLPYIQGYLQHATILVELGKVAEDPQLKQAAYEGAVADCNQLLAELGDSPLFGPYRAAALHSRGVAFRLLGNLDQAIKDFSQAIELNPDSGESYFRRGICFHYIGEDRLAIQDFQRTATINIEDPRARLWEGFANVTLGDLYEAVRAFGQAITESDRYSPAYINRGLVYMQLGEYDKAVKDFNEAIDIDPTVPENFFKRGLAYAKMDDYEQAVDSFASAIALNSKYTAAYRHMADAMAALGRSELADEYRRQADELEPVAN